MELTDEQWGVLEPLIPIKEPREDGKGRSRQNNRDVLKGVLWVLRTGAAWQDLPDRYPSPGTCHRRFQEWQRDGILEKILTTLANDLKERCKLDLSECIIDGTFVAAKKGGRKVGKTKRGKGTKIMAMADRSGLPIAIYLESASPHEVILVEETIASRFVTEKPQRLIGDRAYDSDPLDERLQEIGIELIAPHKRNRVKPQTQDERKLRRFKRRWKIERLNAWLQNFRRIMVRYEHKVENYLGFI
ncbi:MAG TPA: IS5 family transposase [Paludibacter sp.]|nr:IS5 family transposase [Paludibacter sp.]